MQNKYDFKKVPISHFKITITLDKKYETMKMTFIICTFIMIKDLTKKPKNNIDLRLLCD